MNIEASELYTRHVQLRDRVSELERKLDETRDLLSKADAQRARERGDLGRWNQILDNLEKSYDSVRRELERTRNQRDGVEKELSRALDATGETLSAIDAEPSFAAQAQLTSTESLETFTPLDEPDLVVQFSDPDILFNVGWRDLLRMSMEDLAMLTQEEIAHLRANFLSGTQAKLNETDRKLIETRLELAAQLRDCSSQENPDSTELTHRRLQIILRAAIDKIQHNRASDMTNEEYQAVLLCKQRLSLKQDQSPGEKRLLRVIEAALSLLLRQRSKT